MQSWDLPTSASYPRQDLEGWFLEVHVGASLFVVWQQGDVLAFVLSQPPGFERARGLVSSCQPWMLSSQPTNIDSCGWLCETYTSSWREKRRHVWPLFDLMGFNQPKDAFSSPNKCLKAPRETFAFLPPRLQTARKHAAQAAQAPCPRAT